MFIQNIQSKLNEGVTLKENTLKMRLLFLKKKRIKNTINK